jgi:hypothetical protein
MGLREAMVAARRLGARRTYLTGFGHTVSHDEHVRIGEAAGSEGERVAGTNSSPIERRGIEMLGNGKAIWLRPSYDGLRAFVSSSGNVRDEGYD